MSFLSVAVRGIIPAYAGSTGWLLGGMFRCQDHPRIRGEHTRGPRQRGTLTRIIPAYAGSTEVNRSARMHASDHPRIRGEHLNFR